MFYRCIYKYIKKIMNHVQIKMMITSENIAHKHHLKEMVHICNITWFLTIFKEDYDII